MRNSKTEKQFSKLAALLAEVARDLYQRGWALGTSGNFSAVISPEPFRLAITPSGVDKGSLSADQIIEIDESETVLEGSSQPSSEARVHLVIAQLRRANAILHTHSVWNTLLSEVYAGEGGVRIQGYEMLKGLRGVTTHQYLEWLPIVENSQSAGVLSDSVRQSLMQNRDCHGILLRRHGLYTWGQDLNEAKRHVEILEFLLEVMGQTYRIERREPNAVYENRFASMGQDTRGGNQ